MKNLFILCMSSLFLLNLVACSSKHQHNEAHHELSEELVKAYSLHQESLDLREEIMRIEKELDKSIDYSDLKAALRIWDKDIIEVPGFEHSHDDEHQRDYHVHNPQKTQTDEQHLQYQQMMLDEIKELYQGFVKLKSSEIMN